MISPLTYYITVGYAFVAIIVASLVGVHFGRESPRDSLGNNASGALTWGLGWPAFLVLVIVIVLYRLFKELFRGKTPPASPRHHPSPIPPEPQSPLPFTPYFPHHSTGNRSSYPDEVHLDGKQSKDVS